MSLNRPNPFLSKWAENGKRFDVPDTGADHANGRADIQSGFPDTTMKSVLQGGTPPWGQDHNGILHKITQSIQWTQAGGLPVFNQELRDRIGGYPKGIELRSTRFDYVSYINMVDSNPSNPDSGASSDDYWISYSRPGNGWAIKTILSDDADNISYLDRNFRIVTKLVGANTFIYVKPSTGDNKNPGTREKPVKDIGTAISLIPDGGSGHIYLYYDDVFSLMHDNRTELYAHLAGGLSVGGRHIYFFPYGQDDIYNEVYQLNDQRQAAVNVWLTNEIKRPIVYIPVGEDMQIHSIICGYVNGDTGSFVSFSGIEFVVMPGPNVSIGQRGGCFSPFVSYEFKGCNFRNTQNILYLYGGWGGRTNSVLFDHCFIEGTGKMIILGSDVTSLTVKGKASDKTGLEDKGYHFNHSNAIDYFQNTKNYLNFRLIPTSYKNADGSNPNYAPMGLQTFLELKF
ncbi:hypothetical protein [Commensalibacter oyaizuii]|uniref:Uncharacterized protein n=1 Tax=Commensalibacter oyaizuii TaxID=3043873 RepID=A0ABT6Q405_9PROT|nr:hypothetical protein [Commensalibacter sp. TBRC 16381]MDI2091698.1 hypothetical protein [Commensalibacter sp. TBRC 16381]